MLVHDRPIHSYVTLGDAAALSYGCEQVYADLTSYHASVHRAGASVPLDTLLIDDGGYAFPRYVEAT